MGSSMYPLHIKLTHKEIQSLFFFHVFVLFPRSLVPFARKIDGKRRISLGWPYGLVDEILVNDVDTVLPLHFKYN